MRPFPLSTACTIGVLGLSMAAAHLVRQDLNGPSRADAVALVDFDPAHVPMTPLSRHEEPLPAAALVPAGARSDLRSQLLDDGQGVLDQFYASLWRTEKGSAITRVVHYGDSPTTADLITGDIRTLLQKRYGAAGHGFVLIGKPWAWYQHTGVDVSASGWDMAPATDFTTRDGMFGLGGVAFTGGTGAESHIVFQDRRHTGFTLWFLRQPGGGVFTVLADGAAIGRVDTSGAAKTPAWAAFKILPGRSALDLRVDEGPVRIFGVSAERGGPGVVYDSLGLNGASITVLSRIFNADHLAAELKERDPRLVVINYGTNEADFTDFVHKQYEAELREAIRRVRAGAPEASILVMSPMDRGYRTGMDAIETMPNIPLIVEIQRRVARETGCGFFDTYDAMGGAGTMSRWYNAQPRLVSGDFIHPTPQGGKLLASIFAREIGFGLNRFKLRQMLQSSAKPAVP